MKRILNFLLEKIRDRYDHASIRYIISFSFTVVAVVGMLIVGVSFYLKSIHTTETMVLENNKAMIEQVNLNLDSYLRNMMKVSDGIYYNVIKRKDLATENIDKEMDLLYETNKSSLVSICLFSEYGEVIAASPIAQLKSSIDPRNSEWFISAVDRRENLHFSTPHVQNLFVDNNYKYRWVVSLSRSVELTYDGKIVPGVLLVDMNFSGIEQICKNIDMGKSGYVYLIDGNGEIIYHPRQQLIYSNLIQENTKESATYEDGNHIEEFLGEKRIITVKTVGYTGWKIVGVKPMNELSKNYIQVGIFAIFILIAVIFILVAVNIFVSTRITSPIRSLEKSVNDLENGIMDVDISIKGSPEIKHLGKAIKSMVKNMRKLMDDIVVEQEAKRKSELNALQAQINPHFLYNTLDSIIWMIENEKYDGAVVMVTALARLFRISLSKGKNIISLRDELEHAKNYLTIQNIRHKNRFDYYIEADESILDLACIKLVIQPLIENAIYHGMEFMYGDGEIVVKAYTKNKTLYIDIIDNGLGMTEEAVNKLLTNESNSKKGSGIGLRNVNERIKLYFGIDYGLDIYSEPDEGTTIRIRMPKITYSEYLLKEENR